MTSRDIRPEQPRPITIQLDWRAYFLKFCEEHGDPLRFEDRLLFPDGWTYANRYEGPEWPPPEDQAELKRIRTWYWKLRLVQVRAELLRVREMLSWISENQAGRGAKLQQLVTFFDDGGKLNVKTQDLDAAPLEYRLKFLQDDAVECENTIKELENAKQGVG